MEVFSGVSDKGASWNVGMGAGFIEMGAYAAAVAET